MLKKSASGVPRLAETAFEAGRVAQRLNVRHRVRFASSLAAALPPERRVLVRWGWGG